MSKLEEELKDPVIEITEKRLNNCKENYQDLESEIDNCLIMLESNLKPFPQYTLSIVSNLSEMVGEYASLSEKIKGLEREIELLELLKETF